MSLIYSIFILMVSFHLQASPAKLIGAQAFSDKIFLRLFENQSPSKKWTLVDLYFFSQPPESFVKQIGYNDAASFEMKNATPNAFNLILVGVLADNVSQIIADSCSPLTNTPALHSSLQSTVQKLCTWPAPSALDQNVFIDFFHQVTLFDYSADEKQIWLTHFQHPDNLKKSPKEIIYEMTYTLIMNPHYLLKK